jgi:ferric-dicitrate binding protein FerR (iron transport regulator)
MRGGKERVKAQTKQLLRYLDREMTATEADAFRARLAESPELRRELQEMQRVGALLRGWAAEAEAQGESLLEPTLARVQAASSRRGRQTALGYALAAALVLALPWSRQVPELRAEAPIAAKVTPVEPSAAAIERVEATDRQAQVFVLGGSSTPVVWLADEADDTDEHDPG